MTIQFKRGLKADLSKVNPDSFGSCSTAAKTVEIAGFRRESGIAHVKFTITNTAASPTLNINGSGAAAIYYRGAAITAGYLAVNRVYAFVFNGTQYDLIGDVDTNTTYTHPTTDGNLHVPATSTTNNGKFLKAGATAGSIAWSDLSKSDVDLGSLNNYATATQAEAEAGTVSNKFMTPLRVFQAIAKKIVNNLTSASTTDALSAAQGKVLNDSKEPTITAGTTSQYYRGNKTWQDLATAIRAAVLTGLSTATSTAVAATDSVLVAIGKLQAQVTLRAPLASPALTGTPTAPTAASTANSTQIATAAFVKAQGYITSNDTIDGGTL